MLNKTKTTITGCGYIGKFLAQQLLAKKITVKAYVSSDSSLAECKNKNIACEIIDLDKPLTDINLTDHHVIYLAPPPRTGKLTHV
jgi:nucleoside-diphosphate-sugar epimerase